MILIVDDDPNFLGNASAFFSQGNQVCFASNAAHAMTLLNSLSARIGIALVDLDLQGENGYELIEQMRERDPGLPILAISGVVSEAALSSAKLLGANDTVRKPITAEWHNTVNRLRRKRDAAVPPA